MQSMQKLIEFAPGSAGLAVSRNNEVMHVSAQAAAKGVSPGWKVAAVNGQHVLPSGTQGASLIQKHRAAENGFTVLFDVSAAASTNAAADNLTISTSAPMSGGGTGPISPCSSVYHFYTLGTNFPSTSFPMKTGCSSVATASTAGVMSDEIVSSDSGSNATSPMLRPTLSDDGATATAVSTGTLLLPSEMTASQSRPLEDRHGWRMRDDEDVLPPKAQLDSDDENEDAHYVNSNAKEPTCSGWIRNEQFIPNVPLEEMRRLNRPGGGFSDRGWTEELDPIRARGPGNNAEDWDAETSRVLFPELDEFVFPPPMGCIAYAKSVLELGRSTRDNVEFLVPTTRRTLLTRERIVRKKIVNAFLMTAVEPYCNGRANDVVVKTCVFEGKYYQAMDAGERGLIHGTCPCVQRCKMLADGWRIGSETLRVRSGYAVEVVQEVVPLPELKDPKSSGSCIGQQHGDDFAPRFGEAKQSGDDFYSAVVAFTSQAREAQQEKSQAEENTNNGQELGEEALMPTTQKRMRPVYAGSNGFFASCPNAVFGNPNVREKWGDVGRDEAAVECLNGVMLGGSNYPRMFPDYAPPQLGTSLRRSDLGVRRNDLAIHGPTPVYKPIVSFAEDDEELLDDLNDEVEGTTLSERWQFLKQNWRSVSAKLAKKGSSKSKSLSRKISSKFEDAASEKSEVEWPVAPVFVPPYYEKTPAEEERLQSMIDQNSMFASMDDADQAAMQGALQRVFVDKQEWLIREGDAADYMYIVEHGVLEVRKFLPDSEDHQVFKTLRRGDSFGELGLLHSCPRTADVVAQTRSVLWRLDAPSFAHLVSSYRRWRPIVRLLMMEGILSGMELLDDMPQGHKDQLVDALQIVTFSPGETIIREGDIGDTFYIVEEGQAHAAHAVPAPMGKTKQQRLRRLLPGSYFGELALLNDAPRTATVVADTHMRCCSLKQKVFKRLFLQGAQIEKLRTRESEVYH